MITHNNKTWRIETDTYLYSSFILSQGHNQYLLIFFPATQNTTNLGPKNTTEYTKNTRMNPA